MTCAFHAICLSPPGVPPNEVGLIAAHDHVRVQGVHGALTAFDDVGVSIHKAEAATDAVVQQDAGVTCDEAASESHGQAVNE